MYQKRWLHIDPSDNVVDAPLMYQHGWKRDIDYVIGYSRGKKRVLKVSSVCPYGLKVNANRHERKPDTGEKAC